MNVDEVESRFSALRQRYQSGAIDAAEFDRQREQLKWRDDQGRWWVQNHDASWSYFNGNAWVQGVPPGREQPAAGQGFAPPVAQPTGGNPRPWMIAGIVCTVLSLIVLPIVFGPLGIFCGYQTKKKGDPRAGTAVMIAAGVCAVLSAVIGAYLVGRL